MSTKLNAEELAVKRYKDEHEPDAVINVSPFQWVRLGYTTAIREVAQPIADERDELLEMCIATERLLSPMNSNPASEDFMSTLLAILAKYRKP